MNKQGSLFPNPLQAYLESIPCIHLWECLDAYDFGTATLAGDVCDVLTGELITADSEAVFFADADWREPEYVWNDWEGDE